MRFPLHSDRLVVVLTFIRFEVIVGVLLLSCSMVKCLQMPVFVEPIKNVTLPVGSDVEFSCDVRHLGTYRVAWVWEKDSEQRFLGIGVVKITSSPRVHITRLQKSDDITESNLYVYNIKKEDIGTYTCSVNSNPMIAQIGTLDVIGSETDNNVSQNPTNREADPPLTDTPFYSGSDSVASEEAFNNDNTGSQADNEEVVWTTDNDMVEIMRNSSVLCADLNDIQASTKQRISEFLTDLVKYLYTYWFS